MERAFRYASARFNHWLALLFLLMIGFLLAQPSSVVNRTSAGLVEKNLVEANIYSDCNLKLKVCSEFDSVVLVHKQSRCVLGKVSKWLDESDVAASVYHYGAPDHIVETLTQDVGEPLNLSDLVAFFTTRFGKDRINYMEIGVSVGKTLFQVLTVACNANIVAFDLEHINPTFEELIAPNLHLHATEETIPGHVLPANYISAKKDDCSLRSYEGNFRENILNYVSCDEFDDVGWRRIKTLIKATPSAHFQVIFSDALHTVKAIDLEVDRIMRYELLDKENFAYVWDDMGDSAAPFCEKLVHYSAPSVRTKITCVLGKIFGWVGINEEKHHIAIVTTLDISEIVKTHLENAQYIRKPAL